MSKDIAHVLMIEPSWPGQVHLPFNLGILLTVAHAFPRARVSFLGDRDQIERLKWSIPTDLAHRITWHSWSVGQDADVLPSVVWRRWRALPRDLVESADRILMSSVTPSTLNAIVLMGASARTAGFLHGNAAHLFGWRSRNPCRRALDITASSRRFVSSGGQLVVLEKHIAESLSARVPRLGSGLRYLPHPVLPREAVFSSEAPATGPFHIAFAGIASRAKGFPQFIEFAETLTRQAPGRFIFNAIGFLHPDAEALNQSCLVERAGAHQLSREDYVAAMRRQHFLFLWQNDHYYGNAASGVFYDALNFRLPLIARRTSLLRQYEADGLRIGMLFDDLQDAISVLTERSCDILRATHSTSVDALVALRLQFEPAALAQPLAALLAQSR